MQFDLAKKIFDQKGQLVKRSLGPQSSIPNPRSQFPNSKLWKLTKPKKCPEKMSGNDLIIRIQYGVECKVKWTFHTAADCQNIIVGSSVNANCTSEDNEFCQVHHYTFIKAWLNSRRPSTIYHWRITTGSARWWPCSSFRYLFQLPLTRALFSSWLNTAENWRLIRAQASKTRRI